MVALIAILATRAARARPTGQEPAPRQARARHRRHDGHDGDGRVQAVRPPRARGCVVNFFATWCVPCQQEHPELVSFSRRHLQAGDAEVVSVVFSDDDRRRARTSSRTTAATGRWSPTPRAAPRSTTASPASPSRSSSIPNGFVVSKITGGVTSDGLDAILAAAEQAESQSAAWRMTAIALRNEQKRNHLAWLVLIPVLLVALVIGVAGEPRRLAPTPIVSTPSPPSSSARPCRSESVRDLERADRVESSAPTSPAGRGRPDRRRDPRLLRQPIRRGPLAHARLDRREQPRVDPPGRRARVRSRGIAVAFRRWHAKGEGEISDADRRLVDAAMKVERCSRRQWRRQWRLTLGSISTSWLVLEEEREFLLRSLDDLEREHDAGDIDEADYHTLKDDYTRRAVTVLRAIEAGRASFAPQSATAGAHCDRRSRPSRSSPCSAVSSWPGPQVFACPVNRPRATSARTATTCWSRRAGCSPPARRVDAIKLYDQVLQLQPDNPEALAYRGWLLVPDGRPRPARRRQAADRRRGRRRPAVSRRALLPRLREA